MYHLDTKRTEEAIRRKHELFETIRHAPVVLRQVIH